VSTKQERAERIIANIVEVVALLREERAEILAEPGTDGTPFAGHLARVLLAVGGRIPDRNPNRLRWPLDPPLLVEDATGITGASKLVEVVLEALEQGARAPGFPCGEVEDAASIWPHHRTKGAAEQAVTTLARERADRAAAKAAEEHEKRIARSRKGAPAAGAIPQAVRDVVRAVKDVVVPPVRPKAAPSADDWAPPPLPDRSARPDGAWSAGEDFEIPVG
jgi:hypothetical protein